MAENRSKRPNTVYKDDDEKLEELAEEAHDTLPPAGDARKEELKKRDDNLQKEIDRISNQIVSGTIDTDKLKLIDEIASQTKYLTVSGAQPNMVYGWISKNRNGQHIQQLKTLGWETVQGDDPEAVELKGTTRPLPGGTPDTTRQLGDVILMRIGRERYTVLKAMEMARTKKLQQASANNLLEMGNKYRKSGIIVTPWKMQDDGNLTGPEVKPSMFTSRQKAMKEIERHLKSGTVPGMAISND